MSIRRTIFEGLTVLAALVGACTGIRALYFKEPLDTHTEMAKSFEGEIASAAARRDLQKANRVRQDYEQFEENWRRSQAVAALVEPIKELRVTTLPAAEAEHLNELVSALPPTATSAAPETMGAAYLALNEYDSAISAFGMAPRGPKTLLLEATALSGKARDTTDASLKTKYEDAARETLAMGLREAEGTADKRDVYQFAANSPDLKLLYSEFVKKGAASQERPKPMSKSQ